MICFPRKKRSYTICPVLIYQHTNATYCFPWKILPFTRCLLLPQTYTKCKHNLTCLWTQALSSYHHHHIKFLHMKGADSVISWHIFLSHKYAQIWGMSSIHSREELTKSRPWVQYAAGQNWQNLDHELNLQQGRIDKIKLTKAPKLTAYNQYQ